MSRTKKHYMSILGLVLALVIILPSAARADLFGFVALTNTTGVADTLADQFAVDVTEPLGDSEVWFTFYNNYDPTTSGAISTSPIDSVLTDVYFADGILFEKDSEGDVVGSVVDSSTGVSFSPGASPGQLPPGEVPGYSTFFSADSDPQDIITNGVSDYPTGGLEYVTIGLSLLTTAEFGDVIEALNNGDLLIGLHVQAIYAEGVTGGSDWFVTPVPGAAILGLIGLGIAGIKLRKYA